MKNSSDRWKIGPHLVQLMEGDSGGVVLRNLTGDDVTTEEEEALQLFCMVGCYSHHNIHIHTRYYHYIN